MYSMCMSMQLVLYTVHKNSTEVRLYKWVQYKDYDGDKICFMYM